MSQIKPEPMMQCKNNSPKKKCEAFIHSFRDFQERNTVAMTTQHKRCVSEETQFLTHLSVLVYCGGKRLKELPLALSTNYIKDHIYKNSAQSKSLSVPQPLQVGDC